MAKQYKIKRYRQYGGGTSFRAKPRPVTVVLGVIALAALVVLGIIAFPPVYDFFTGDHTVTELDLPDPVIDEDPDAAADPNAEPGPENVVSPVGTGSMRAVYLPTATAADATARANFLQRLSGTDINAVMVDIKDASGTVLFRTGNEQAAEWGAVAENAIDLPALADELKAMGLSLVARMWAFQDPLAAGANRDMAIGYQDTAWLWLDNTAEAGGKPWLNPYADSARSYLTSLAVEAAEGGATLVVLESVQCPAGSANNANFGESAAGTTRTEILSRFMEDITASLQEAGAATALYITAVSLTQEYENTLRYGGSPLLISTDNLIIGALPYQFGTGFSSGELVIEEPVQNPGGATETVLNYVNAQLQAAGGDAPNLIPLLQGGNEPGVNDAAPYTQVQVDAQLGAVTAHNMGSYILYCTTGEYLLQP